jgi:hypothetical protein
MLIRIKNHPVMATGFALTLVLATFFAIQLLRGFLVWPSAADGPIEGWMTVGYVARAQDVPRDVLAEAIGVATGRQPHQSLSRIAEGQGESLAAIVARLDAAIARHHESRNE